MQEILARLRRIAPLIAALTTLTLLGAGTGQPVVSVPQNWFVVAGSIVNIPVTLNTGGAALTQFQFGFDLNPCLVYQPSPGVIFNVPSGYGFGAGYDPAQTTQELKMLGYTAGTTAMTDGVLLSIPFLVACYPPPGQTEMTVPLPFSETFPRRFYNVDGAVVQGSYVDGSMRISGETQTPMPILPTATPTQTALPTATPTNTAVPPTLVPGATATYTPVPPTSTPTATPILDPAKMPGLVIGKVVAPAESLTVEVPVTFTAGVADVSAILFSIDFDEQCLDFVLDASRFNVPPAFVAGLSYNATDTDGEIDITLVDYAPPLSAVPSGLLLTLTFDIRCKSQPSMRLAPLNFSMQPTASYGGTQGQDVPGWLQPGVIMIMPPPTPETPTPTTTATPPSEVVVEPGQPISTTFGGASGQVVHVDVPAGAVDQPTTLTFQQPAAPPPSSPSFQVGGFAFEINVTQNGQPVSSLRLNQPIVLDIVYTDADVVGMVEEDLQLFYYDPVIGTWLADGITVISREPAANRIVVSIEHLTTFAVGVEQQHVYLPTVQRGR